MRGGAQRSSCPQIPEEAGCSIQFTTFVTGATSGIGEATCRRFVSAGAKVIVTGRRADRLEALKAELGEACSIAALDVRDRVAVEIGQAITHSR